VGKEYSSSYDFVNVNFSNPNNGSVLGKINYKSYNPKYNDIILFNDHANISLLQHVTFSYDKTNMPGIIDQEWKITNNNTGENIYYDEQWLTYLFTKRGDYTIELTLTDCNGNTNTVSRNMVSVTVPQKARPKKRPNYQYTEA